MKNKPTITANKSTEQKLQDYIVAQRELKQAKERAWKTKEDLKLWLLSKYGCGVHVLFGAERLCAWVFESIRAGGFRHVKPKQEVVLKVRAFTKKEQALHAEGPA